MVDKFRWDRNLGVLIVHFTEDGEGLDRFCEKARKNDHKISVYQVKSRKGLTVMAYNVTLKEVEWLLQEQ